MTLSLSDIGTHPRGTVIPKVNTTKIPLNSWTDIPIDSSPIEIVDTSAATGEPMSDCNDRMTSEEDSNSCCLHCGAKKKFEFQVKLVYLSKILL